MSSDEIYFCPQWRLYSRKPSCSRFATHADVPVGDMLTVADLADHELAFDLAEERYRLYQEAWRP